MSSGMRALMEAAKDEPLDFRVSRRERRSNRQGGAKWYASIGGGCHSYSCPLSAARRVGPAENPTALAAMMDAPRGTNGARRRAIGLTVQRMAGAGHAAHR